MSSSQNTASTDEIQLSCVNCAAVNCAKLTKSYPDFCLTTHTDGDTLSDIKERYMKDPEDRKMAITSAELEAEYYGRATRVEEMLIFIKKMGYTKIGLATCSGLLEESSRFTKAAKAKGIDIYGVICKVGALDKTEIGLTEDQKVTPGAHESMCNPILQAELLNARNTEFNIIVGLCVGHDSLFIKYSNAPVSYLIVKDRVLCHNPAAALYGMNGYYSRLLKPNLPSPRK